MSCEAGDSVFSRKESSIVATVALKQSVPNGSPFLLSSWSALETLPFPDNVAASFRDTDFKRQKPNEFKGPEQGIGPNTKVVGKDIPYPVMVMIPRMNVVAEAVPQAGDDPLNPTTTYGCPMVMVCRQDRAKKIAKPDEPIQVFRKMEGRTQDCRYLGEYLVNGGVRTVSAQDLRGGTTEERAVLRRLLLAHIGADANPLAHSLAGWNFHLAKAPTWKPLSAVEGDRDDLEELTDAAMLEVETNDDIVITYLVLGPVGPTGEDGLSDAGRVELEIIVTRDGHIADPDPALIKVHVVLDDVTPMAAVSYIYHAIEATEGRLPDITRFWYLEVDYRAIEMKTKGPGARQAYDRRPVVRRRETYDPRAYFAVPENGRMIRVWVDIVDIPSHPSAEKSKVSKGSIVKLKEEQARRSPGPDVLDVNRVSSSVDESDHTHKPTGSPFLLSSWPTLASLPFTDNVAACFRDTDFKRQAPNEFNGPGYSMGPVVASGGNCPVMVIKPCKNVVAEAAPKPNQDIDLLNPFTSYGQPIVIVTKDKKAKMILKKDEDDDEARILQVFKKMEGRTQDCRYLGAYKVNGAKRTVSAKDLRHGNVAELAALRRLIFARLREKSDPLASLTTWKIHLSNGPGTPPLSAVPLQDRKNIEALADAAMRELQTNDDIVITYLVLEPLILALHAGFITSYLLSPVHFLTLLIRTLTQIHLFTPPRKFRSLRLVLVAWALVNALSVLIHALDGSKGTKGSGWHGKGIIVDIIGQIHTPSRVKLITLDLIIAAIQFVVVLLTFAAAETASAGGTPSALLGDNIDEWSDDDEEEDGPEASNADDRPIKRLIPGDRGVDFYGTPVVNIRLRAVWQEVARGTRVPNDAVRMEEGRAESGTPG
ncbi:hypothetical protein RQP46_005299 [Phenoliferia psychrophenolica]